MKRGVFIIAEAGVNHNGKLNLAIRLVRAAASAGADAVKFQTFRAGQVVVARKKTQLHHAMLEKVELPEKFYKTLMEECKKRKIMFLSTPHGGRASVDFLESLKIPMYKIGSGDLTNYILLAHIAKTKKPVILSTGMATMKEIKETVHFLKQKKSGPVSVLHCTTDYPCPLKDVNLRAMVSMMKELSVPVGYSDHTVGIQTAIIAVTLGAEVYECHFTLNKTLPGPDHRASATPLELKERIQAIRNVESILGSPVKKPTKSEKHLRGTVRRSIVAAKNLIKGQKICESDIEAKRPGDGLSPVFYQLLIGKKVKKYIQKDQQISMPNVV